MDIQNFVNTSALKMLKTQEEKDSLFKAARVIAAMEQGMSVDFIEKILKTKGDINYKIPTQFLNKYSQWFAGGTVLHATSTYIYEEFEVVKLFLKYVADFTIESDMKDTALHEALDEYYERNDISSFYRWPLHRKLSDPIVNEMLSMHVKKSIKENPSNQYGLTHLHIACMADHYAAVEFFLNNLAPVDLLVNKNSPLCPECTPLHIAVKSCAINVVKVLLKHGANQYLKDNKGMTAMHWLIERNRKIVDFEELKRKAEFSIPWSEELKVNQQIVELLLNSNKITSGIVIDEIGLSDLHVACTLGNAAVVEIFLKKVSQIDRQVNATSDIWPGYTALHFAAHFDLNTVKLLLTKGANIMIESTEGYTPFEICLERYPINDIYSIISNWKSITLGDGKIKLLDLILAMQNIDQFRKFLDERVDDINISVAKDSLLLPGNTILHLTVLFSEQTKNKSNYTYNDEDSYVIVAQFHSNQDLVEECLIRGADVTIQDLFGRTPLHLAFRYHKTATIKRMLQFHYGSINPIDKCNLSHLHIACAAEDNTAVTKILQSGADLNLKVLTNFKYYSRTVNISSPWKHFVSFIPTGSTPLHIAVAVQSYEIIKLLVNYGADVNAVDANEVTPIHRLLVDPELYDMSKISQALLSANLKEVVVAGAGLSHLFVASYYENYNAVKRLLDLGADVDVRLGNQMELNDFYDRYDTRKFKEYNCENTADATTLNATARYGSTEVLSLLINYGADILIKNAGGSSALYDMIDSESRRVRLTLLIELFNRDEATMRRVQDDSGLTLLHIAAFLADTVLVKTLLDREAHVNAQINDNAPEYVGRTALHFLIMGSSNELINEFLETMKLLFAAGADVTITDAVGNTPLHLIVNSREYWVMQLAEIMWNNIKDFHVNPAGNCGLSLFHVACLHNNLPIMKKFLEYGVDIDERIGFFTDPMSEEPNQGNSALHLIIEARHYDESLTRIETLDFLLKNGAHVNAQNIEGSTPLHTAIYYATKRVDIFDKLIRAGADLNKLNECCSTPFELLLCSDKSTPEGIKLFIDHGCGVNVFDSVSKIGYLTHPLTTSRNEEYDETAIWDTLFKSSDITKSDLKGRTAIHNIVSVSGQCLENITVKKYSILITRLCNMGCDIDSQDQAGETALHYAAHFKNNEAIAALLMNGANINIVDGNGKTAFSLGLEYYEGRSSDEEDFHKAIIETFYIHTIKMQYLKLDLNHHTRGALLRVFCLDFIFELIMDKLKGILEEIKLVKSFSFEDDSISFKLGDILSETGLVAVYPIMGCQKRLLLDKFFENFGTYVADHPEAVGLLKLQYRKAINRITFMHPATESLKVTVGFPLPEVCCSIVMRFLSNTDLENLVLSTGNSQDE